MSGRRPLIAGNWKMNGLRGDLGEVGAALAPPGGGGVEVVFCLPATLIAAAAREHPGVIGAQDCRAEAAGAFTGDISAPMLADLGCAYVIVGHSERRQAYGEADAAVQAKAAAVLGAGMCPIVCVGETAAERDAGAAERLVTGQLAGSLPEAAGEDLVVAYEPIWAIGTGRTPTLAEIASMFEAIRQALVGRLRRPEAVRVLYGGSVKPDNAAAIFALGDVDGALVGGASLKADSFRAIIRAHPAAGV
jgi:triosephosphate isomerase